MAFRTEIKKIKKDIDGKIVEVEIINLVFDLTCKVCGAIGGEVRFPKNHGRPSDEHLEMELALELDHRCELHKK